MDFTGTIARVMPLTSGVSQSTGNAWAKQEYVLDLSQPHTGGTSFQRQERVVFTVFGQDKIAEFRLKEMETVTVSVDFNAREYNGRWYNDIRAWRVQRSGEQDTLSAQVQVQDPVVQAPAQMSVDAWNSGSPLQAPQTQTNLFGNLTDVRADAVKEEQKTDDLPF